MRITTIGLGYIGLPTSLVFARHGANVHGVDINEEVVDSLNFGRVHIKEPGVQEILNEVINNNKFKASLKPEKADAFIISVPTPKNENKSINTSFILDAVHSVIPYLEKGNVIIIESTIAPRTTVDEIKPIIESAGYVIGKDIYLVHCPERVLPGNTMHELIYNNRIVGGLTPECTEAGASIYNTIVKGEIIKTDANTAEMSKLMENTFRDVNIALANELTKICNELEIDALKVIEMANKHPRVNMHTPGPGVGGHCLAVDPYFIISKAPQTANLIKSARNINDSMPSYVVENIDKLMKQVNGKKITIFGLTYKGNIDDIRESPAMEIYNLLKEKKEYELKAYDPYVKLDWIEKDIERAIFKSDLIVILTDHNEFKKMDWKTFSSMNNRRVFDTKNIVQNPIENIQYINYGNLHKFI